MASPPDIKFEAFPLQLAVWKNEKDGKTYYSCRLTKRWKHEESGEWRNTESLSARDLPGASALLMRAYMEIGIQKST